MYKEESLPQVAPIEVAPLDEEEEDEVPVRRSARTHKAPNRLCLNVEIIPDQLYFNVEVEEHSQGDNGEPASYKAALSDPEFVKWLVAMNAEIQSMYDNKVWKLVPLPPNAKVVKGKWIYKKKTDMDGMVYIYKARLVAKGFTQTYGVDYEETFSPVADIRSIRILLAIAPYYDQGCKNRSALLRRLGRAKRLIDYAGINRGLIGLDFFMYKILILNI